MNTMRHPLEYFPPEGLGAMHAGIVEHHNGEGVWILLDHKLVKRFYDRFRGHCLGCRVIDQFSGSAYKNPNTFSLRLRE